jgi:hypothetical protein
MSRFDFLLSSREPVKTSWDYVVADIVKREEMGYNKYGKYLSANTDENMLQHLYEELLDATVYIKTLILQKEDFK